MKNNKKTDISEKPEKKVESPLNKNIGIVPLGDRVLLKLADVSESENSNKFGIIIPETVSKEKPEQGVVVAVGEGKRDDSGKRISLSVKVGDTVVFSKYSYDEVKHGGEEYIMVKEENILAIVR